MRRVHNNIINKRGFSLAEVLIVVAILVVLATVSIPIFTSQIKTARRNSDIDNYSSACHSAITAYYALPTSARNGTITYIFDASTGMVQEYAEGKFTIPEGYGLSSSDDWNGLVYNMGYNYPCNDSGESGFVVIQFINGDMSAWWETSPNAPATDVTPSTSGAPLVQLELMEE
ncbi:MAG: prepilin-type N-terminal cleavage/methylation domain-containing protein [Saccharofermentans sp.]|nr:prepilin-type N-terminal cleavage/methylation domain-containing protein [Saccharofermentans sp.]